MKSNAINSPSTFDNDIPTSLFKVSGVTKVYAALDKKRNWCFHAEPSGGGGNLMNPLCGRSLRGGCVSFTLWKFCGCLGILR